MKTTAVETILFQTTWNDTFGTRPTHAAIKVHTDEGLVGNSRTRGTGARLTNYRKMAALAEAYHVLLAPHGASWADLHASMAAALPNTAILDGRAPAAGPGAQPEVYNHVWQDFKVERGRVQLSRQPGLGLDFDEALLRRYRVAG